MAYGDRVERDPAELRRGGRKRLAARRIGRWLGTALTWSAIVAPLIVWLTTGSVGALAVIYAAEALLGVVARAVARSLRLPAWSASESYIGRLRRWQTDRRAPSSDPPASLPSSIREALRVGMSAETISDASGLSPETVRAFLQVVND